MPRSAMPYSGTSQPRRTPSRRAVAGGALWAVPVVTLAATAPAVAASTDPIVLTITGNGSTGGPTTTTDIKFNCKTTVSYTVQGGSGGDASLAGGGVAAVLTGTLVVPAGTTLKLIAGGKGDTRVGVSYVAGTALVAKGGLGYGNGGNSGTTESRSGGGGGGGSAILVGTTALVVAGGGGGMWIRNGNTTSTAGNPFTSTFSESAPGSATGGAGGAGGVCTASTTHTATSTVMATYNTGSAAGGSGATGGAASTPTTTVTATPPARTAPAATTATGVTGGNNGTGANGGGNGGVGGAGLKVTGWANPTPCSGGGGGGGYAGGAGGSSAVEGAVTTNGTFYTSQRSVGAGGGAGSSFSGSGGGVTTNNTSGVTASTIGEGTVRLSWMPTC
jgi:hypothetical protein